LNRPVPEWPARRKIRDMTPILRCGRLALGAFLVLLALAGCERPPVQTTQIGYRGTGMVQADNPRTLAANAALQTAPEILRSARIRENAPLAGATYQNVTVLGELTIGEFGRTMNAITAWVSPQQSCAYCHIDGDLASDAKYTKVVARRMLEMVRRINADWKVHIADTGVTCYTCHRGQPLPKEVWFRSAPPQPANNLLLNRSGQNMPALKLGLTAMPLDVFAPYLAQDAGATNVRVTGRHALPQGTQASLKQTEATYNLMMHFSVSLGVNCTFCHNSRSFPNWAESTPQRTTAWHAIRMAREVNTSYLAPLDKVFPANLPGRLGPTGDAAKVSCVTCHQGVNKPLFGVQTARYYPALWTGPVPAAAAASAPAEPASAAAEAPVAASAPVSPPPAAVIEMAAQRASAPLTPASVAPAPAPVPVVAVAPSAAVAAPQPVAAAPAAPPPPAGSAPVADANCIQLAAAAARSATRIGNAAANRQVTGAGRLAFLSAPHPDCRMQGVFILPGEPVEADREVGGYTLVFYRNPRTGGEATGWVLSPRLELAAASPTPATAPAAAMAASAALAAKAAASATALAAAASAPVVPPAPTAVAAVEGDANCIQLALAASRAGKAIGAGAAGRLVIGTGRLQFHAAPDPACRMQGLFILPGEPVEADREVGGFTSVWYHNPRTGNDATGWVRSNRLQSVPSSVPGRP
jgi:photosynthetic reaction center cytochrome c subunit